MSNNEAMILNNSILVNDRGINKNNDFLSFWTNEL